MAARSLPKSLSNLPGWQSMAADGSVRNGSVATRTATRAANAACGTARELSQA
jgi:hypothetical protein